jgi:addiction module HigA family antidote
MTSGASCSGGVIQARREWKLLTTTADTDYLEDRLERQNIPLLPYVRVGDIEIFTGYAPKGSGESKKPYRYLGYVGAVPECRPPTSPGEMLLEEFLKPLGISQRQLARDIRLPYRHVNDIINERRRVTPTIALRLTRYLGMSVGFWMNLQLAWDLYHAAVEEAEILGEIEPFPRPDLQEPDRIQEQD